MGSMSSQVKTITAAEVKKLREQGKVILTRKVSDSRIKVYDASDLLSSHPGGESCLLRASEEKRDCQPDFLYHSKYSHPEWEKYFVGEIVTE